MANKPLPRVPFLRVKDTRVGQKQGTCVVAMTNLLNCWASYAEGSPNCERYAVELKDCMLTRRGGKQARSSINYHSNRLLPKVNPPPHD